MFSPVDEAELEERMRAVGVADTAVWPIGATIRPPDVSAADTVRAPMSASKAQRSLPHLSVDLGGSSGGRPPGSPVSSGADLEVRAVIGEGGMGRVFLARQHSLQRDVAVKTAKDGAPESVRRAILSEAVITGQLEHPAIVPVHALGVDAEGRPAMVMKRIEGESWDELARDPAHEGWEGWDGDDDDRLLGHLQILVQICNALHFAHSRGIVHRDIKLTNVLIGRFGDVYLADWGIATRIGEAVERLSGTPGYMAPEMVDGRPVDERTDVYLLGATLHELLTGEMRHGGKTAMSAILSALLSEPHAYHESVPVELADLANRACQEKPSQRPADAMAFRDALLLHVRHRESAALGAEGAERVGQLEQLLRSEEPDDDQRREIDRLTAEARFGLETALAQWPRNVVAKNARARLEAILETRREHAAELEREARERDPKVAARPRAIGLLGLGLVSVAIAFAAFSWTGVPSRGELVLYPVLVTAIIGVATFVQRRSFLATKFNRQVVLMLFVMMGLITAGRLLGLLVDIEPAEHLVRDGFLLAAGLAVGAIAYLRWFVAIAFVFLVSGVLGAMFPEHAIRIFSASCAVAVLMAAGFQWRAG